MFVRIESTYIWFGTNKQVDFVGPFPDQTAAIAWQSQFDRDVTKAQLTITTSVVNKREANSTLYASEKTARNVLTDILDAIDEYCRG